MHSHDQHLDDALGHEEDSLACIWNNLSAGEADELLALGSERIALSRTPTIESLMDARLVKAEHWSGGPVYMTTQLGAAVAEYGRKQ